MQGCMVACTTCPRERGRERDGNNSSTQMFLEASRPDPEKPQASEPATIQSSPGLSYFLQHVAGSKRWELEEAWVKRRL